MAYVVPAYITSQDLINRVSARTLTQYCDDDGDGVADVAVVEMIIQEASAWSQAYLLDSFGLTEIGQLAQDPLFKGAVCDIALSLMGERRAEFGGADPNEKNGRYGKYPYGDRRDRGERTLDRLGKSYLRLGAEKEYGDNQSLVRPAAFSEELDGW
ncbi:phage protein Gp36 family protein [Sorangium sp. So ce1389]|uniref:phage protein Gp36 family protein n=1 Tax=Sorangium sp. So ce1389 TaxID=3133336 RepID=UPI003F60E059